MIPSLTRLLVHSVKAISQVPQVTIQVFLYYLIGMSRQTYARLNSSNTVTVHESSPSHQREIILIITLISPLVCDFVLQLLKINPSLSPSEAVARSAVNLKS